MKGQIMSKDKKIKTILMAIVLVLVAVFISISKTARGNDKAEMLLFYAPTCPHCHKAIEFLDKIEAKYPNLKITKYNTSTRTGANYYMYYKKKLNFEGNGVPVAVFGDKYELGFGSEENSGKIYTQYIEDLLKSSEK